LTSQNRVDNLKFKGGEFFQHIITKGGFFMRVVRFQNFFYCFFLIALFAGQAAGQTGKSHRLHATPQTVHTGFFDSTIPPALTIESGDTVVLSTWIAFENMKCGITWEEFAALRKRTIDRGGTAFSPTGPIFVNGAEPGDVLEVRIKKLVPGNCGMNWQYPGNMNIGGLPEDFPDPQIKTIRFNEGKTEAYFAPGIVIPLTPFMGTIGVAPRPGERRPAAIPDYFGGNMDNKELVAGTTLYLPVNVKGALFSTCDAHGAQGDGEVNITAIETTIEEGVFQFVVRKDMKLERPMAETPTHWITMGFHKDLDEAVKIALRDATQFLMKTKGLSPGDAYALASIAVDMRITQIVDTNKGAHAMIPKAIFRK
jgi:acetamidase/formamidase